jgi:hypothetical protein
MWYGNEDHEQLGTWVDLAREQNLNATQTLRMVALLIRAKKARSVWAGAVAFATSAFVIVNKFEKVKRGEGAIYILKWREIFPTHFAPPPAPSAPSTHVLCFCYPVSFDCFPKDDLPTPYLTTLAYRILILLLRYSHNLQWRILEPNWVN